MRSDDATHLQYAYKNERQMTLQQKSEESIQLVSYCFNNQKYCTAAGGRPYYAVFQRIKHLLETENFDYSTFLDSINSKDKLYSHGTISMAFSRHISATRKDISEASVAAVLLPLHQLYKVRRDADYVSGSGVTAPELKRHFESANAILKYIDQLPAKGART